MYIQTTIVTVVILYICYNNAEQTDWDSYTAKELHVLPELRRRVAPILAHTNMHENRYLVRYLRARDHNLDATVKLMEQTVAWRKKYDVDNMIYRDFSALLRRLPFYFIEDYEGRPSAVSALRDLSIRKLVVTTGGVDRLRDYLIYAGERAIWHTNIVANSTGKELIESSLLFNMAGFNLRNHVCGACIPLWIELTASYETYNPRIAYKIIVINAPRALLSSIYILKPFASSETLDRLQIYGVNKAEWLPVLLKNFRKEDLEPEFGGTGSLKKLYTLSKDQIEMLLGTDYVRRNSTNFMQ